MLAHSPQVEIAHACASKPLLVSCGIATHSCLGIQLINAECLERQQTPGHPAWTIVLHPAPLHAEQQLQSQAQASDQHQSKAQRPGHLPQLSAASPGVLSPAWERLEPEQLLQAWAQHQLKVAMSRQSAGLSADAQHQPLSGSMGIPLGTGSILAASCRLAQSGAQSSNVNAPQQLHEPSSCLQPSVNQDAFETTAAEACQGSSHLYFQVELVRGRQKGPQVQPHPPRHPTQHAAAADLDTTSSFRPTASGREEPSGMGTSDTRPRLEAFVNLDHIQSKQIEVKYGSPSGQHNISSDAAFGSHQSPSATLLQPAPASKGHVGLLPANCCVSQQVLSQHLCPSGPAGGQRIRGM